MLSKAIFLAAAAALTLTLAVACSNTATPSTSASAASTKALVVTYPNGGGTTVFVASPDGGEPMMLMTAGTMPCKECQEAALKYFQTGILDPKCSLTGATRTVMTYTPPTISHN